LFALPNKKLPALQSKALKIGWFDLLNGQPVGSLLPQFSVTAVNSELGFDGAEGGRCSQGRKTRGNSKVASRVAWKPKEKSLHYPHDSSYNKPTRCTNFSNLFLE